MLSFVYYAGASFCVLHGSEVICCHLRVPSRDTGGVNPDTKFSTVINKAQTLETLELCGLLVSWISGL